MDLETERQFFRAAATVLLARLYFNGGAVPGLMVTPHRIEWLIGELDNTIEMQMILEEERKKYVGTSNAGGALCNSSSKRFMQHNS